MIYNTLDLKTKRLKYLAEIIMGQSPPSSEYSYESDSGLPFLQGTAEFNDEYPSPSVYCPTPRKIANRNDILFSVRAPVGELNVADQDYGIGRGLCAIRPMKHVDRRFLWWALHWSREQLKFVSTGSTYQAVTVEDVSNIKIPSYKQSKQVSIADYLDNETKYIDDLITEKKRLNCLLEEKRSAVITNAILGGLDSTVTKKHSGVPWIGEIPIHWNVDSAHWLFQEVDNRSESGEEELLSVSHLTGVTPRSEKDVNMFLAESLAGYKVCKPGDLIINTLWAWMGAMGIAFQEGLVSPSYHVYRLSRELDPRYIDYLVRIANFASEVTRFSKGVWSSRLRLYPDEFYKVLFPVPPLHEQRAIANFLSQETETINEVIQATNQSIELLEKKRSTLISFVISGQISV